MHVDDKPENAAAVEVRRDVPDLRPAPQRQINLAALTGLRFLAAADVVLYHFARVPLPHWAAPVENVVGAGFVGVSLFFILSGFIMAYSYLAPDGTMRGTSRNFYASRFARIAPAYLLGFLLATPTDIVLSLRANPLVTALVKLVINATVVLTFLQAWTPLTAWAWNFPAWSVSVEVFFYAIFPWLGPRLSRVSPSRCLFAAAGLWLLSLAAPAALYLLQGPTGPPHVGDYLQMAVEFTPLLRLPEFAIGILAGRAFVAGRFDRLPNGFLSLAVGMLLLVAMAFSPQLSHPFLAGGLLTPLFALLIISLAAGKGPLAAFLSLPWLVLLGEASYGIYILQIPVSYVLRCPPPHTSARTLLLYCAALVAIALVSFRFVESPLRVRLRRQLSGPEAVPDRTCTPAGAAARLHGMQPSAGTRVARPEVAQDTAGRFSRRSLVIGASAAGGVGAVYAATRWMYPRGTERQVTPGEAIWVSTTQRSPWQTRPLSSSDSQWTGHDVTVHVDRPAQIIEGFGGCFNELGWLSLAALKTDDQERVFREFFAPGVGANFNLCRMPIGANDFSRGWYSYDEVPGDFALEHFSIANDLETLVPFIESAKRFNPRLRLWASPWSPPSWMKRNGFYAEAAQPSDRPANGIRPEQIGRQGQEMFVADDRSYAAYARYFAHFIDAYRERGIDIGMVMPQNEFNSPHPFPSCTWSPGALARLITHLGPAMSERGAEIFVGTLETGNPALLDAVLRDEQAARYVRGVGAQWEGRKALPVIHKKYPDLRIYQSEQECGDGENDWRYCVHCWDLMKSNFDNGANAYMYWNFALPPGGESHWGWKQNSLVTVEKAAGTYHFNHEYYLIKHLSHFVQPGARRLLTNSHLVESLAFANPDGSIVVVVRQGLNVKRSINIIVGGRRVSARVDGNSFNTLLLRPEQRSSA